MFSYRGLWAKVLCFGVFALSVLGACSAELLPAQPLDDYNAALQQPAYTGSEPVTLVLELDVSADGDVTGGEVLEDAGQTEFADDVLANALHYRFVPATLNDEPIASTVRVAYTLIPDED